MKTPTPDNEKTKSKKANNPLNFSGPINLVTTPIIWWSGLGFSAVAILLAWSIYGRVPVIASGQGAFTYPFRVQPIPLPTTSGTGTVSAVYVKPGDFVKAGQLLATLDVPSSKQSLTKAKATLDLAQEKYIITENSNRGLIESGVNQVKAYKDLSEKGKYLLDQGVISKTTYLTSRGNYISETNNLETYRNNIRSAKKDLQTAHINHENELEHHKSQTEVSSLYEGYVLNTNYSGGEYLSTTPLGQLLDISGFKQKNIPENLKIILGELQRDFSKPDLKITTMKQKVLPKSAPSIPLYLVSYFNQTDGNQITTGMEARIIPDNIKANTVGTLRGIVQAVYPIPVGAKEGASILGSDALSASLITNNKAYYQALIVLVPSTKFPSGYEWISGKGPTSPNQIPAVGIKGSVSVIVEEKPPITIALPALREAFGLPQGTN